MLKFLVRVGRNIKEKFWQLVIRNNDNTVILLSNYLTFWVWDSELTLVIEKINSLELEILSHQNVKFSIHFLWFLIITLISTSSCFGSGQKTFNKILYSCFAMSSAYFVYQEYITIVAELIVNSRIFTTEFHWLGVIAVNIVITKLIFYVNWKLYITKNFKKKPRFAVISLSLTSTFLIIVLIFLWWA